ncbi:MAG TPA: universal stress protein [Puia sp.]|jgi:nucleotide-binding universal stress UspA family protein|nr:universal stress protein [Puia sp.]
MKPIVVPVNFSANSNNAARYAADMALAIKAELHLIHFVQIPVSTAEFPINDYIFEEMQKNGAEGLNQLWDELVIRTGGKVNIFTNMEVGGVEYRLEEFCARKKPFAVVMGSAGPFLERVLAGSNLSAAIRHLPYPLIIVPENAVFRQFKKIVLACDLDDIAEGMPVSPGYLKTLQDAFGSSFEVINITTERQDKQDEAEAAFKFNSWKDRLVEIYPEVRFIPLKNVEDGIGEYLAGHPADLLLVFPKRHNFFEFHKSHAKKIAFQSKVPVMSIHA